MTITLGRQNVNSAGVPRHAGMLLRLIGVQVNADHLWERGSVELHCILKDAKDSWRARAKRAHPDNGGTHDESARLNVIWSRLETVFEKHGVKL